MSILDKVNTVLRTTGWEIRRVKSNDASTFPKGVPETFRHIAAKHPLTQEFNQKIFSTYNAVDYLVQNRIPGDLVECGVFQGKMVVMMALTLLELGETDRRIFLYDTFAGMTEPDKHDSKVSGRYDSEANHMRYLEQKRDGYNERCYCPEETVRANVLATGYPANKLVFVKGDIRETIPNNRHELVALLRLDTDWHTLTRHELIHMYPILVNNGILIIDDYNSWTGARKAVDEYFAKLTVSPYKNHRGIEDCVMVKPMI